jgi:apolipoprotein N-acyltransferase
MIGRGPIAWASVFIAVILFGQIRLTAAPSNSMTSRVAAIAATSENITHISLARNNPDQAAKYYQTILNDYLDRTREQALAGAKLAAWDELAIRTEFEDEPAVIQQGQDLARETQIYLLMAMSVENIPSTSNSSRRPRENKVILIGPDGEVIWEYIKSFPTPGSRSVPGDGKILTAETYLGRLSAVICFDADNPQFIRIECAQND